MPSATSVSNTAYGIINDAMVDVGFLQEGQRPNSDQLAAYLRRLNDIINLWQTYGLKLFLQELYTVTLVQGGSQYLLPNLNASAIQGYPIRVLQAYVQQPSPSTANRPVTILSLEEGLRLPFTYGTNNIGAVNSIWLSRINSSPLIAVNTFLAPDATEALNTLYLLVQYSPAGPIFLTDTTSFPQEWRIALRWGLADDICTGQPDAITQKCANYANIYRQQLENWDVEDAPTYFNLDARTNQSYGSFR